ncbi:MAG: chemotaxis response regulator protein-glutamate methylesterase [Negativicutes bacterium]|nr:chemotaxis response regulator protein-glutamate methylesterase [Negativicutes bacterium]
MIKILVVDDSAFMRKVLSDLFKSQPDFEVVDIGRNGAEAVEKVKQHSPDVVTLDVEMPVMDGLTALEQIMAVKPTPVVMVSSLTKAGADATIKALSLGAVDFVAKSAGSISRIDEIEKDLLQKCREAAGVSGNRLRATVAAVKPVILPERTAPAAPEKPLMVEKVLTVDKAAPSMTRTTSVSSVISGVDDWIVAIGTSTGGPRALQEVLTRLPGNLPCPTVIVQHMPPGFTKSLAERLNTLSELTVKEAADNDKLVAGTVYIAPGDFHLTLRRETSGTYVKLNKDPAIGGLRPAVDPMMVSVAETYGTKAVGVILTGMGHDGAKGMKAIKRLQGRTIAEDQSTSVVFGMPKAAIEAGVVDSILPLQQVAEGIVQCLKKGGLK